MMNKAIVAILCLTMVLATTLAVKIPVRKGGVIPGDIGGADNNVFRGDAGCVVLENYSTRLICDENDKPMRYSYENRLCSGEKHGIKEDTDYKCWDPKDFKYLQYREFTTEDCVKYSDGRVTFWNGPTGTCLANKQKWFVEGDKVVISSYQNTECTGTPFNSTYTGYKQCTKEKSQYDSSVQAHDLIVGPYTYYEGAGAMTQVSMLVLAIAAVVVIMF